MKIFVVVDMQNDFINGSLGTAEAQAIVPKVAQLIKDKADPNTIILFTQDTHKSDYLKTLEGKNLPVEHCLYMTNGWLINKDVCAAYEEVKDKYFQWAGTLNPDNPGNQLIWKPSFGSIDLQNYLYEIDDDVEKIEEITFCGLCTGICVLSNAILAKATLPEVPVKVVKDCCACVSPESHETALNAMALCQIEIV